MSLPTWSCMILIFDLDDTLYQERLFVESGLRAVARFGADAFNLPWEASYARMKQVLSDEGRGRIFDIWLSEHELLSRKRVAQCVKVYRHHMPDITLPPLHREILTNLGTFGPLFLVTDGHKIAQHRKIEALDIADLFARVFITHRFGVRHAKPSLHCFDIIRRNLNMQWDQLLYVGDNPAKDFVNLNSVGATTVRVRTGAHANTKAQLGFEARYQISKFPDLVPLLRELGIVG